MLRTWTNRQGIQRKAVIVSWLLVLLSSSCELMLRIFGPTDAMPVGARVTTPPKCLPAVGCYVLGLRITQWIHRKAALASWVLILLSSYCLMKLNDYLVRGSVWV